jgi:hypothetical protein
VQAHVDYLAPDNMATFSRINQKVNHGRNDPHSDLAGCHVIGAQSGHKDRLAR